MKPLPPITSTRNSYSCLGEIPCISLPLKGPGEYHLGRSLCTFPRLFFLDVPQGRSRRRRRRILFVNRNQALIPFSAAEERFSSACCLQTVRCWRHPRTCAMLATKLSANYPPPVWKPFAGDATGVRTCVLPLPLDLAPVGFPIMLLGTGFTPYLTVDSGVGTVFTFAH